MSNYAENIKAALGNTMDNTMLLAAYLTLGAMGDGMALTEEEVMQYEGEHNFVSKVLAFTPMVRKVSEIAVQSGMEFPGVFLYDVVDGFGNYLRQQGLYETKEQQVEALVNLATTFFGESCDFMTPELLAV